MKEKRDPRHEGMGKAWVVRVHIWNDYRKDYECHELWRSCEADARQAFDFSAKHLTEDRPRVELLKVWTKGFLKIADEQILDVRTYY